MAVQPVEESQTSNDGGVEALSQLDINLSGSAASVFLKDCMNRVTKARKAAIIRFVFSCARGYIIRSDFLVQRLECCAGVERVVSFTSPLRAVPNAAFQKVSPSRLPEVMSYAIGSLLLQDFEARDFEGEFLRLDNEFKNRLSFPWLQANPIPRRRIV